MKIYLAGPIFSEAERSWRRNLNAAVEELAQSKAKNIKVIFPYDLIGQDEVASLGAKAKDKIFEACRSSLDTADVLVALLDGSQVDDGTAWEIGYFYAKTQGKTSPIIGIRTDFRRAGESEHSKVNAMIDASCDRIVSSVQELIGVLDGLMAQKCLEP